MPRAKAATAAAPKTAQSFTLPDLPPTDAQDGLVDDGPSNPVLGTIDVMEGIPEGMIDAMQQSAVQSADDGHFDYSFKSPLESATPVARDGYMQQWVRIVDLDGNPDPSHKAEAFAMGWRPREGQNIPPGSASPIYEAPGYAGGVCVFKGQLLLCEMPTGAHDKMMRRLSQEADKINTAIYNHVGKEDASLGRTASVAALEGRDASDLMDAT